MKKFFTFILILASSCFAQDDVTTRRVDSVQGAEVILNQVDTSAYPKVNIFATVLKDGNPVVGLKGADFRVREDEVDQEPLMVEPKLTNLNSVITVDTSGSIRKALPKVKAAAKQMISSLEEEDKFSVISFARKVKVISSQGSKAKAASAIDSIVARGDTALYDAAYQSVKTLENTTGRKVVILITDGVDDNGAGGQLSERSVSETVELAKTVNVPIYAIGLGSEKDEAVLKSLSSQTGGKYFDAATVEELAGIYETIGKQLEGQYSISYTSNLPADGTVRRLTLSQGDLRSSKEYTAPSNGSVTSDQSVKTVVAPVEATNLKYSFPDTAGLHVLAVTKEGAEPVKVGSFELFKVADSSFEKDKSIKRHYKKTAVSFNVPSGKYKVVASLGDAKKAEIVEVDDKVSNTLLVNLNAGSLRVNGIPAEGQESIKLSSVEIKTIASAFKESERVNTLYNKKVSEFILTAGKYSVKGSKGKAEATAEVEVVAGEQKDVTLVLAAGVLKVAMRLKEGGETIKADSIIISKPKTAFKDSERVANCYSKAFCEFTLNAGDYLIEAKEGSAVVRKEITITANDVLEEILTVNAGLVNIAATRDAQPVKAKSVKIYPKLTSALQERETLEACYSKKVCSKTLPAGEYSFEVSYKDQVVSKDFSLAAGQVLNIEVSP